MKKYVQGADKFLIDNLKYGTPEKPRKVSDKITIGWETVLPEPRSNSSEFTKSELNQMEVLTKSISSQQLDLIKMVDADATTVFDKMISKYGMTKPIQEYDKAWSIVGPIILNLKWKFNRPRPYQLAGVHDVDIKVVNTDTHHTPAYPSGHSAQAAIMGYILADMYPEYSSEIFQSINLAGVARVLQGVHYPSDNDASMVITGALWEDIKDEILKEHDSTQGDFMYEDLKTGEMYTYKRRGLYKKDGRTLVYRGKKD